MDIIQQGGGGRWLTLIHTTLIAMTDKMITVSDHMTSFWEILILAYQTLPVCTHIQLDIPCTNLIELAAGAVKKMGGGSRKVAAPVKKLWGLSLPKIICSCEKNYGGPLKLSVAVMESLTQ